MEKNEVVKEAAEETRGPRDPKEQKQHLGEKPGRWEGTTDAETAVGRTALQLSSRSVGILGDTRVEDGRRGIKTGNERSTAMPP